MSNRLTPRKKWLDVLITIGAVLLIAAILGSVALLNGSISNGKDKTEDNKQTEEGKEPIALYRGTGIFANDPYCVNYETPPELSNRYVIRCDVKSNNWTRAGEEDGDKYWEIGRSGIESSTKNMLHVRPKVTGASEFNFETDIRFTNASDKLTPDMSGDLKWIFGIRLEGDYFSEYFYFFAKGDKISFSHSSYEKNIIAEIPLYVWYNIRIQVIDRTYKIYINGEQVNEGEMGLISADTIRDTAFEVRYYAEEINVQIDNTYASGKTE